jgi:hypothetical protein
MPAAPNLRRHLLKSICLTALALAVTGCATHNVTFHEKTSADAETPLGAVMVMALAGDAAMQQAYEDRAVAQLAKKGVRAVPFHAAQSSPAFLDENALRELVGKSGVDGILMAQAGSVENSQARVCSGAVVTFEGWGGLHSAYMDAWRTARRMAGSNSSAAWGRATVHLFDARDGRVVWTGRFESSREDNLRKALEGYAELTVGTLVADRAL